MGSSAWNQEYLDSAASYNTVPMAMSLDLASKDRPDGIQYRVGLHQVCQDQHNGAWRVELFLGPQEWGVAVRMGRWGAINTIAADFHSVAGLSCFHAVSTLLARKHHVYSIPGCSLCLLSAYWSLTMLWQEIVQDAEQHISQQESTLSAGVSI